MALYCNLIIVVIPILGVWLYTRFTYTFAVGRDPAIRERARVPLWIALSSGSLWWLWLCLPLLLPDIINYRGYGYLWVGLFLTAILAGRLTTRRIGIQFLQRTRQEERVSDDRENQ